MHIMSLKLHGKQNGLYLLVTNRLFTEWKFHGIERLHCCSLLGLTIYMPSKPSLSLAKVSEPPAAEIVAEGKAGWP